MTNEIVLRKKRIEKFMCFGAKKKQLRDHYYLKGSSTRNEVVTEMNEVIAKNRNISIKDASKKHGLRGKEVEELERRLG